MAMAAAGEAEVKFHWTSELTAHVLESVIMDKKGSNGSGEKILFLPNSGSKFQPLKTFACYLKFCKSAFVNGIPPKACTIEEYEQKLEEMMKQCSESKLEG